MTSLVLLFVIIVLCLIRYSVCTLDITLHNVDVIKQDRYNESLTIEYTFQESFVTASLLSTSSACILINGQECQCFDDINSVVWSAGCKPESASYWFSILFKATSLEAPRSIASLPVRIETTDKVPLNQLTLILPLTLDDLSRAALLIHSLKRVQFGTVYQMLIFVPDSQHSLLLPPLQAMTLALQFDVVIYPESVLFHSENFQAETYPYGIQMAIKLLCARLVQTRYYLTLDADVILNQDLSVSVLSSLLPTDESDSFLRTVYENEPRTVHPTWWSGSEAVLRLSSSQIHAGFGVTPALISTYGSLLTLNLISQTLGCSVDTDGSMRVCDPLAAERAWLTSFGRNGVLWSEYTLYRLALDHYEVW